MKLNYLYKTLMLFVVAALTIACNDTLDEIGFTQQPERDRVTVSADTLELAARTIEMGSIFARTQFPVLGHYVDPVFGSIKSEYLGGFFLPTGASFTEGANIDSVRLVLSYTTMLGDSLAPMRLSVFQVNRSLDELTSMTGVNPREFADMTAPLGEQTFTGRNSNFREELIQSGMSVETIRVFDIPVRLPVEIGQNFLAEYLKPGHGKLANNDVFNEWFPGLYLTTTFGSSTIINVAITSLFVHYNYLDAGGSSVGQDTIRANNFQLHFTPEVMQVNTVQTNNTPLLVENDEYAYIKSPAGVKTELTFPMSKIYDQLDGDEKVVSLADFTVFSMPDITENLSVRLDPPTYLLLINSDSLTNFFEHRRLPDNRSSFISERFDTQTFTYRFGNISSMFNYYKQQENRPDEMTFYLIPVDLAITTTGGNQWSQGTQTITGVFNQMWPTATILDKRQGSMRVSLIFSEF